MLLIYLHIYYQLKTSSDKEVFEIGEVSKEKLEEICDLRQPAIINYRNSAIIEKTKEIFHDTGKKYKTLNMNIYNTKMNNKKHTHCIVF